MTTHYFTVDVEEYFHVSALEAFVRRTDWLAFQPRAAASVDRLLGLMAAYGVHGTFFVLGWVAEQYPDLVRRIAAAGHEIASHGWAHERVTTLTPKDFRNDIRRAKRALEDLCGQAVLGYRAPSFSITRDNEWALDVLVDEGYVYDSSLMPVRRPGYGYRGGGADVHWLRRAYGRLLELPPATLEVLGVRLPAGGGAYLRLLPAGVVRTAFKECEKRGMPGTLYVHPWEFDPDQPRFRVPWWTRIRHYGGLATAEGRLRRLFEEFRFGPIASCPELQ
ncbi:MAG TPA: XrtA system polysaccharide deacetylase [Gemmatimonadaceae bacterium]